VFASKAEEDTTRNVLSTKFSTNTVFHVYIIYVAAHFHMSSKLIGIHNKER